MPYSDNPDSSGNERARDSRAKKRKTNPLLSSMVSLSRGMPVVYSSVDIVAWRLYMRLAFRYAGSFGTLYRV